MSRRRKKPAPTVGQEAAVSELRRIAAEHEDHLSILSEDGLGDDGYYRVTISLPTGELTHADGGLRLKDSEEVTLAFSGSFPLLPPRVDLDHVRFAGHPHVLQGYRLCAYLDPSREWHPKGGVVGFLDRLWDWFTDAAAGRLRTDAAEALHHPVGGVVQDTAGQPVVVVRERFPTENKSIRRAYVQHRSDVRSDLFWYRPETGKHDVAVVVSVHDPLYFGAGTTLPDLLRMIERPRRETVLAYLIHSGWPPAAGVMAAARAAASRNSDRSPLLLVIAVPNTVSGVPYLLAGRIPAAVADLLRLYVATKGRAQPDPDSLPPGFPIEWCEMSDERPEISIRRDQSRPVSAFAGKHIHVWGCGGIGSWAAEFVARARPAQLTLCDPERVKGGLLVRQNYTEDDVGKNKAEALAARMQSLHESLLIHAETGPVPKDFEAVWRDADVLIDATVNLGLGYLIDQSMRGKAGRPVVAQLATDVRTGTLGIMSVAAPGHPVGPATIDENAGKVACSNSGWERFHTFWNDPVPGDELVPARGCSVPTFHGSSADLAAVAASLTTLLALYLGTDMSGTHLVALPHAEGEGPNCLFLEAGPISS